MTMKQKIERNLFLRKIFLTRRKLPWLPFCKFFLESQKMLRSKSEENCRSVFQKNTFHQFVRLNTWKTVLLTLREKFPKFRKSFDQRSKKGEVFQKCFSSKCRIEPSKGSFVNFMEYFLSNSRKFLLKVQICTKNKKIIEFISSKCFMNT